jgi:hypothetical protein
MRLIPLAAAMMLFVAGVEVSRAAAPPVDEVVSVKNRREKGVQYRDTVYKSGRKEVVRYQRDRDYPLVSLVQDYNSDNELVREREYGLIGTLLFEKTFEKRGSDTYTVYHPFTGKPVFRRSIYILGDVTESTFGDDGKVRTVVSSGGCIRGVISVRHFLDDGRDVKRMVHHDGMSVVVSKNDRVSYTQQWKFDQKTGKAVLVSVEHYVKIGKELGKRIVKLAADGVTIEKAEYYKFGKRGWDPDRTEDGAKLSEPVESSWLKDPEPSFVIPRPVKLEK